MEPGAGCVAGRGLLVAVLVVALGACSPDEPMATTTAAPTPAAAVTDPPTEATSTPEPLKVYRSTAAAPGPWARTEVGGDWHLDALDPGGEVLQVTVPYGGCEHFERLEVEERTEGVTLSAWLSVPDASGEEIACEAMAAAQRVVIVLDHPLGDRALLGCLAQDCLRLDRDLGFPWAGGSVVTSGELEGLR